MFVNLMFKAEDTNHGVKSFTSGDTTFGHSISKHITGVTPSTVRWRAFHNITKPRQYGETMISLKAVSMTFQSKLERGSWHLLQGLL